MFNGVFVKDVSCVLLMIPPYVGYKKNGSELTSSRLEREVPRSHGFFSIGTPVTEVDCPVSSFCSKLNRGAKKR